jgi:acyl CoA:acetate/3-ketoacid CoA transferase alpha subunit
VAEGKETRDFEGKTYLMEQWLRADFAIVKAWKGEQQAISSSKNSPQFQSDDGHSREYHHCRSGRTGAGR